MYDVLFFFFKQKTAYEMRISDWSSDVCSSDLLLEDVVPTSTGSSRATSPNRALSPRPRPGARRRGLVDFSAVFSTSFMRQFPVRAIGRSVRGRSEEHTSELQSLMRISYAVFCLQKKIKNTTYTQHNQQ